MSPNLKPRRIPCLTHVLTRHPIAAGGVWLGGAHGAGRQRFAQPREHGAGALAIRRRAGGDELGDLRLEAHA